MSNKNMNLILESLRKGKEITESKFNDSQLNKLCKELESYSNKNGFKGIADFYVSNHKIMVDISDGDWKHEHLRLDNLVADFMGDKGIDYRQSEENIDDDGSDVYSATHVYEIV